MFCGGEHPRNGLAEEKSKKKKKKPLMSLSREQVLEARATHLAPALSTAHGVSKSLMMVRGEGQYMFDEHDNRYLDCINNVTHVGHGNARVARAAFEQMEKIATNSRYLHPLHAQYLNELTATMPESLSVVFLVASGSEANDLALRMARLVTGHTDLLVLEG